MRREYGWSGLAKDTHQVGAIGACCYQGSVHPATAHATMPLASDYYLSPCGPLSLPPRLGRHLPPPPHTHIHTHTHTYTNATDLDPVQQAALSHHPPTRRPRRARRNRISGTDTPFQHHWHT